MPVSFQTIREFKSDNMIWDDQKGVMKSAGLWHKFKTRFDIGHAREQNAATLEVIKAAIVAQFPSDDLKELAEKKINQVRTDRLVGAAQIRGILDSFEHLGSSAEAAIKQRTMMHMAAHRDLPVRLWCVAPEIVDFVSNHIARDPNVRRNPRSADIPKMTAELVGQITSLVDTVHHSQEIHHRFLRDLTSSNTIYIRDEDLFRTVVKNLEGIAWKTDENGNSVLRPDAFKRMNAIRNYWIDARDRAQFDDSTSGVFLHRAVGLLDSLLQLPDPYDGLVPMIRTIPAEHVERRNFGAVLTHMNSLYPQKPEDMGPMLTEADILPVADGEFSPLESPKGDEIG